MSNILKDPEASSNDRFVALELLKNANIAAGMILPGFILYIKDVKIQEQQLLWEREEWMFLLMVMMKNT